MGTGGDREVAYPLPSDQRSAGFLSPTKARRRKKDQLEGRSQSPLGGVDGCEGRVIEEFQEKTEDLETEEARSED